MDNKHTFQTTKHSKRYWQDRVYKPEITRADGARDQSPNFAVRLSHAGRSMRLSLGTPNGAAAADLAREMFVFLTANGWISFLAKYRSPTPEPPPPSTSPGKKGNSTVGEYLTAVRAESDLSRKTFDGYVNRFRFIVSQLFETAGKAKRHDYRTGGTADWVSAIDAVPLEYVTSDKIRGGKSGTSTKRAAMKSYGASVRSASTVTFGKLGRCSPKGTC